MAIPSNPPRGPGSYKEIALISVLIAFTVVVTKIPAFPLLGVQGSISLGAIVPVIIGFLLPPPQALITAVIGGSIASIIPPAGVFGPLSPLPMVLATLAASMIFYWGVKGLASYVSLHLLVILGFIAANVRGFLEYYYYYPWFHVLGLIIAVAGFLLLKEPYKHIIPAGVAGVLVDHMSGSLVAQVYFPLVAGFTIPPEIWATVSFIYPVERTILIAIAVAVVGILYRMKVAAPWRKQSAMSRT